MYMHTCAHVCGIHIHVNVPLAYNFNYGVATISKLLKIIGLFCKRAL